MKLPILNKIKKYLSATKSEEEEKEAKNKAILESIGEGVIAVDKKGIILLVNRAFEKMLGWKQDEVIGKRLAEIVPREDEEGNRIPFEERLLLQVFAGSLPFFYFVRKDKTRLPVNSIISPITIDQKIIGAVEVFHDLTKEKELEKVRMDFLTLASHQLRTPLSGTKWLIETMKRGVLGPLNDKQRDYMNEIYGANERMIKLVSDMINVLRLESGTATIKKETIFVSDLGENLSVKTEAEAGKRKIIFRNALKNYKTVAVETDAALLQSVLECFVTNAFSYSQPDQEVVCDAKEEADAVMFSVKDSGIGIPKDEQKRIFERFYRASNAKQMRPDGTGLGLYIASVLADKIGAKVSFESEEGKGSTFYLRVPKRFAKMTI